MKLIVAGLLMTLGCHSFLQAGSERTPHESIQHSPIVALESSAHRLMYAASTGSESSNTTTRTYPAVPASFFGMTVLNQHGVIPALSYSTTRTWDAYPAVDWADTNPLPGRYDFKPIDVLFAANKSRDVIFTLGRTPQWASSAPEIKSPYGAGQCAPPENLATWDAYVRAVSKYVHGRTHYWELWNEPDGPQFYCGDISRMVEMAKHAHTILKEADPQAILLSPPVTASPGPKWLESFLAEGGGDYVDVIAFHGYWSATAEDIESVITSYRSVMRAYKQDTKPMWDTEVSWAGNGNLQAPSIQDQAAYIAKSYLLHWSGGVERVVWYAYDASAKDGGMMGLGKELSVPAKAYDETYRWLLGATLTSPCTHDRAGTWSCTLTRMDGYRGQILWNSNATVDLLPAAGFVEYRDLSGAIHHLSGGKITIGTMPVMLETSNFPVK